MRIFPALLLLAAAPAHAASRDCTPEMLRAQLQQAKAVVAACSEAPGTKACDPAAVGDDVEVALPAGRRTVEFGWLRSALADAAKKKDAAVEMEAAAKHLDWELAALARPDGTPPDDLHRDQAKLQAILASGRFPQPQPPSLWQRMREIVMTWLEQKLTSLAGGGSGTRFISEILMIAAIVAACGALLLWFTRATKKQRIAMLQERVRPAPEALAASEWQIWLEEARQLAGEGHWREAIHRVYWVAIFRLEARGAWRPDRTRTPREYLELLGPHSASNRDLLQLTRCLERFWYGGHQAEQQDFAHACQLLERLAGV